MDIAHVWAPRSRGLTKLNLAHLPHKYRKTTFFAIPVRFAFEQVHQSKGLNVALIDPFAAVAVIPRHPAWLTKPINDSVSYDSFPLRCLQTNTQACLSRQLLHICTDALRRRTSAQQAQTFTHLITAY